MRNEDPNSLKGDLRKAQRRIRTLADVAARHLDAEKLNALAITIGVYLDVRIGRDAVTKQITDELESERQAEYAPGGAQ